MELKQADSKLWTELYTPAIYILNKLKGHFVNSLTDKSPKILNLFVFSKIKILSITEYVFQISRQQLNSKFGGKLHVCIKTPANLTFDSIFFSIYSQFLSVKYFSALNNLTHLPIILETKFEIRASAKIVYFKWFFKVSLNCHRWFMAYRRYFA